MTDAHARHDAIGGVLAGLAALFFGGVIILGKQVSDLADPIPVEAMLSIRFAVAAVVVERRLHGALGRDIGLGAALAHNNDHGRIHQIDATAGDDAADLDLVLIDVARVLVLGADVDPKTIARGTPGFSGADLANVKTDASQFQQVLQQKNRAIRELLSGMHRSGAIDIDTHEIEATATSMVVVVTYWLSYEYVRDPRHALEPDSAQAASAATQASVPIRTTAAMPNRATRREVTSAPIK